MNDGYRKNYLSHLFLGTETKRVKLSQYIQLPNRRVEPVIFIVLTTGYFSSFMKLISSRETYPAGFWPRNDKQIASVPFIPHPNFPEAEKAPAQEEFLQAPTLALHSLSPCWHECDLIGQAVQPLAGREILQVVMLWLPSLHYHSIFLKDFLPYLKRER